jgi:nitroreductase
MNPNLSLLFARRSVRNFATGDVSESAVTDMLEAAMAAPSAACKDPWEFIVIRDIIQRGEIAEGLPNGKFLAQAAVGIVVCGNLEKAHAGELSYLLQDCSAAIENLLLAAQGLGYGACWLGVHPRQERVTLLRTLLDIPDHVLPVGIAAIGVPAVMPAPRTRFRAGAVHLERW